MSIDTKKILNASGVALVKALKDQMDRKNLNDTREARRSLSHNATDTKLQIEGLARIIFLNEGRKPGTMPPISSILPWVISKLGLSGDEATSAAWAIAKKIQKFGTDIFTDKAKGLQVELIVGKLTDDLHEIFSEEMNNEIGTLYFNALKA